MELIFRVLKEKKKNLEYYIKKKVNIEVNIRFLRNKGITVILT